MGALFNRVSMAVSGAPGTGAVTLGAAASGFQSFAAAGVPNGTVVSYVIVDGTNWEVGQGTYASGGPTLTRTTVQATSAGNTNPLSLTGNAIVSVDALAPDLAQGAMQGAFKNLKIINGGSGGTGSTANTTVVITADTLTLTGSLGAFAATGVNLSVSTATVGANGLDTGTLAASTWYALWVASNGLTTIGVLSASATAPTLPTGYAYSARYGWVRTDASKNLFRFVQYGRRSRWRVTGETNNAGLPLMVSGAQGSYNGTYVAVALASYVPSTAATFDGTLGTVNALCIAAPSNSYGGQGSSSNPPPVAAFAAGGYAVQTPFSFAIESGYVYYAGNAGWMNSMGWEDNI